MTTRSRALSVRSRQRAGQTTFRKHFLWETMGNLLGSSKKPVWVPVNEKLEDKVRDVDQWQISEDLTGWKVCNDGIKFAPCVKGAKTASLNLSFNGLGDDQIAKIAPGLEGNKSIAKLILANNFIHVQ
jgi:hypothetical protein